MNHTVRIGAFGLIADDCYRRISRGGNNRRTIQARQVELGGVPCIRGLRIPVATIVGMTADGMSAAEVLEAYPDLESGDIRPSLQFAAHLTRDRLRGRLEGYSPPGKRRNE